VNVPRDVPVVANPLELDRKRERERERERDRERRSSESAWEPLWPVIARAFPGTGDLTRVSCEFMSKSERVCCRMRPVLSNTFICWCS
jgi:hypothetical protein